MISDLFTRSEWYLVAGIVCAAFGFLVVLALAGAKADLSRYKKSVWFYLGDNPGKYYNEEMIKRYWQEGIQANIAAQRLVSMRFKRSTDVRNVEYIQPR